MPPATAELRVRISRAKARALLELASHHRGIGTTAGGAVAPGDAARPPRNLGRMKTVVQRVARAAVRVDGDRGG